VYKILIALLFFFNERTVTPIVQVLSNLLKDEVISRARISPEVLSSLSLLSLTETN
jgi:hypothetical protein